MNFMPAEIAVTGLDAQLVDFLIEEQETLIIPRLQRLWDYYRNEAGDGSSHGHDRRPGLAQERGLPARLTRSAGTKTHREIVIENDIAWRIHTLVDFMFGRAFAIQSLAMDPQQSARIESFLNSVFDCNGGIGFFQDLALLGAVHGYVDVLLRIDPALTGTTSSAAPLEPSALARRFVLETVEAPRAIPVIHPQDYRRLDAYLLHYHQQLNAVREDGFLARLQRRVLGGSNPRQRAAVECTEIWTAQTVAFFRERVLVEQTVNRLGRIPVVHIQNLAQPFFYEGLSEVEPLIPLQDELNTRLSDRANRVTFQAFKMYLGKGIDGFIDRPVGPGQMWATDNLDASIQEFGGDARSPSEDAHIGEIRDALDKTSGVSAIAAGLLRDKVGNLSSENALRIVLMGLLAKTERRRVTYGQGIERMCALLLQAADVAGGLPNGPADRRIRIDWPSPLPENTFQRLQEAQLKLQIGVPREQILTELGYGEWVQTPVAAQVAGSVFRAD